MNITYKCHLLNLCNKHTHIKFKVVKMSNFDAIIYIDFMDF